MKLEAIIFDVDGTLAETERHGHRVAFNAAFEELQLGWHWDETLYGKLLAVPGGKARLRHWLKDHPVPLTCPADSDLMAKTIHRCKTRHYQALIRQGAVPLRAGVVRLLREAHGAGVRLAIATAAGAEGVQTLLEQALPPPGPDFFQVVVTGDDVARGKPAPDIYLRVLEQLDVPPERCIAIEDAAAGLQAAREAGLTTLVTVNDYTAHEAFPGAAAIIDSLGEPDAPCRVLAGELPLREPLLVDLPALEALVEQH